MTEPVQGGKAFTAGRKRRSVLLTMSMSFLAVAIAVSAWWLLVARYRATTDNAYVSGNVIQIASQVSGTVVAVHADDTDFVEEGQVLVELDDADARIALQSAEAALADAVREVRGLYAGAGQSGELVAQRTADTERMRQELFRTEAELQRAKDDFARKEKLYREKFISDDALQIARTAVQAAEAVRAAARASVNEAGSALAGARKQKDGADVLVDNTSLENHPRVAAAAARVKEAYLTLRRTR
ncbi:MAG: biotin/lipoyl-binding protein, partial [Azoarcus sp.]|nr:biotin/lipoyl-binding protein [Azoarcus sp.]